VTQVEGFDPRALIEQQAREWLIRLDGDEPLSHAQRRALEEWVNRSTAHRDALMRLAKYWKQANTLTDLGALLPAPSAQQKSGSGHGKAWLWVAASAGLAAIFIVAWPVYWTPMGVNRTYTTAVGEQKTVPLPDGSSIALNTDSRIEVDYSLHLRSIRLARGEALFSVTHDPARPFQVYAANEIVRAVGTAFAVQVEAGGVNVTVTNGAVDVSAADRSPPDVVRDRRVPVPPSRSLGQLKAGQTSTIRPSTQRLEVRELAAPELDRRVAWHDGFLVFSGQSLGEVVGQVNRYSPVRLEIADPQLSSISIGGRFRVGDLDAVLGVLHDNFGVQSSRVDEHTIRLGRDAVLH
jgi:transmembrane sensor